MSTMCIGIQTDGNEICDIGWLTFYGIKIHKGPTSLPSLVVGKDEVAIDFRGKKNTGQGLILVMSEKDLDRLSKVLAEFKEGVKMP